MAALELDKSNTIKLEQEMEGERLETADFFFEKIGEAVPLQSADCNFNLESLPAQPLAVSERFQLIFVAHSEGFCVARSKDVIESAKEIKENGSGTSIKELSIVDVALRSVHILALSTDSSTLAVTVAGDIHFFSVNSFLSKEDKISFSCSLSEPCSIKDLQWNKKLENSYVVLSKHGKLYHGVLEGPPRDVMDDVDAVEWSVKGNFIAVARKNVLSILSSKFKESFCIELKTWTNASDGNCVIKVDSIRWIRPDCIILGCFQLSANDKEEGYLVQIITSKNGKITDTSSEVVVLSFCELFSGLVDDIVPFGSGPYLFLSYLEQCKLAITANRKNTDQHIVLFGWPPYVDKNEAAVIDIGRDHLLPRIELQENGGDNLIVGLSIDKVSLYDKVKVQLGVEEQRELSPYCVLLCLTLEGKVLMFHVASVTEAPLPPQAGLILSDEEDTPAVEPLKYDKCAIPSGSRDQKANEVVLGFQLHEASKNEPNSFQGSGAIVSKNDPKVSTVDKSPKLALAADQTSNMEVVCGIQEVKALVNSQKSEADRLQEVTAMKPKKDSDDQTSQLLGLESTILEQPSLKAHVLDQSSYVVGNLNRTGAQKFLGADYFSGRFQSDTSDQSTCIETQKRAETSKEFPGKDGLGSLQGTPSQSRVSARSSFSSSNSSQINRSENADVCASTGHVPADPVKHSFNSNDTFNAKYTTDLSASVNLLGKPTQSGGWNTSVDPENVEPLLSIHSSQFSSWESSSLGRSPNNKLSPMKEPLRISPSLGQLNSGLHLSKQFGNVNEMANELDTLLECIEEAGGFRDACTILLKSSIVAIEQGIGALSDKCRMWRSIMDEQIDEIQHISDNTVQVLSRRIYMEGIVKQATDIQYWDLWNRQKLSSELDLKKRQILEVNQDLTNQLIELEKHFNTLELTKFGANDGANVGRRNFPSKIAPPRHIQSLHSLHTAMNSQLAAAEQLSDYLSKQMDVLSIDSPAKQKKIKKELFETIGIPYDGASFSSPDVIKFGGSPLIKKIPCSSNSVAVKDHSMRSQSNARSNESETARRRRDSLGQSWASFEPSKATVQRMLLQSKERIKAKSSLSMDKQHSSSHLEGSMAAHSKDHTTPSTLYQSRSMGIQDTSTKQATKSRSLFRGSVDFPGPSQSVKGTSYLSEKSGSGVAHIEKCDSISLNETKSTPQSESHLPRTAVSTRSMQTPSMPMFSNALSSLNNEAVLTKPTTGSVKHRPTTIENSFYESRKSHDSPFAPMSAVPAAPTISESIFQLSQPTERLSSSPAISISLLAASSSLPVLQSSSTGANSTSAISASRSLTSSKGSIFPSQSVSSPSLLSASSQTHSSSFLSFKAPDMQVLPPIPSSSAKLALISPKPEFQHPVDNVSLKTNTTSATTPLLSLPEIPTGEFSSKLEPLAHSNSPIEAPTGSSSGSQPSISDIGSPASNYAANAPPEQSSPAHVLFPGSQNTVCVTGEKNDTSDISVTNEDEMEEEAPQTSQITELSIGNLGGFGIGSASYATAAKPNPFGGSFANAAASPASSPFSMTVPSGELFRPASFSFQSPQTSQPANIGSLSGGFSAANVAQTPSGSGFGQPTMIGPGQQALGSVLGAFGQFRQLGTPGFGGGFSGIPSTGGFANAATGNGFANVASSGGGFGAFSNQQGIGGFSAFGTGTGGTMKPQSQLFTQMRK